MALFWHTFYCNTTFTYIHRFMTLPRRGTNGIYHLYRKLCHSLMSWKFLLCCFWTKLYKSFFLYTFQNVLDISISLFIYLPNNLTVYISLTKIKLNICIYCNLRSYLILKPELQKTTFLQLSRSFSHSKWFYTCNVILHNECNYMPDKQNEVLCYFQRHLLRN